MTKPQIETLKNALLRVELEELEKFSSLPDIEATFSNEFEKNIKKLDKKRKSLFWNMTKTMPRKIAVIFAAAIITLLLMMGVSAITNAIIDFYVSINEKSINISIDANDNGKESIEKSYLPTYIPSGYLLAEQSADVLRNETIWENGTYKITFSQTSLINMAMGIDNEDSNLTEFKIGPKNVFCIYKLNNYCTMWLEDGYVFEITCHGSVSLEEIKQMIESTKIVHE